jgi:hypothetical protein
MARLAKGERRNRNVNVVCTLGLGAVAGLLGTSIISSSTCHYNSVNTNTVAAGDLPFSTPPFQGVSARRSDRNANNGPNGQDANIINQNGRDRNGNVNRENHDGDNPQDQPHVNVIVGRNVQVHPLLNPNAAVNGNGNGGNHNGGNHNGGNHNGGNKPDGPNNLLHRGRREGGGNINQADHNQAANRDRRNNANNRGQQQQQDQQPVQQQQHDRNQLVQAILRCSSAIANQAGNIPFRQGQEELCRAFSAMSLNAAAVGNHVATAASHVPDIVRNNALPLAHSGQQEVCRTVRALGHYLHRELQVVVDSVVNSNDPLEQRLQRPFRALGSFLLQHQQELEFALGDSIVQYIQSREPRPQLNQDGYMIEDEANGNPPRNSMWPASMGELENCRERSLLCGQRAWGNWKTVGRDHY